MKLGLPIALSAALLASTVQANDCFSRGYINASSRVPAPVQYADELLQASLAAARQESDAVAAIAKLQEYQFGMWHPDIPRGNPTGYYRVRCGNAALYSELNDAIAQRVEQLKASYRANRQLLGQPQQRTQANGTVGTGAGLLNLLLIANQHEQFEQEAARFLRKAIGDSEARKYFGVVYQIAGARQDHIRSLQEAYSSTYAKPVANLLPVELKALTALQGLPARLDPIRAEHVAYWLAKEEVSYNKILAQAPVKDALLGLTFELGTANSQLELALGIALPKDQDKIRQHAIKRGDALVALDRHEEASTYYDIAGATEKLRQTQQVVAAANQQRLERMRKQSTIDIEKMKKTSEQRASFEEETDSLAEELGIDLDDF